LLADPAEAVPRTLSAKPVLVTFPYARQRFPARSVLPRMRQAFSDARLVELPRARHFFVEAAPEEVAAAVIDCFGSPSQTKSG
jgi:haloalkane dehalogenase